MKRNKISVEPKELAPVPMRDTEDGWDELGWRFGAKQYLIRNVKKMNWGKPTPIQIQAIPALMADREVLCCAPTGSGKTGAFVLPLLMHLKEPLKEISRKGKSNKKPGIRAVIISPTRELALQTHVCISQLSEGKPFKIHFLSKATGNPEHTKNYDVLISTPLRLVRLIQEQAIDLSAVEYLVFDEADQLFEMGFLQQVDEIIAACSAGSSQRCKRALFSATLGPSVLEMASSFMVDPLKIVIGEHNSATDTIKQELVFCGEEDGKLMALRQIVQKGIRPPVLIFVQTKERAVQLFHELVYDNINVDIITSDRTRAQRDRSIEKLRRLEVWVLICTDLMARGMDFKGCNLVINYDMPSSAVQYIHRIGRTGRAGRDGHSITFYTHDDVQILHDIVEIMRNSGMKVPDWMLGLPAVRSRALKYGVTHRKAIYETPLYDLKAKKRAEREEKRRLREEKQDELDAMDPELQERKMQQQAAAAAAAEEEGWTTIGPDTDQSALFGDDDGSGAGGPYGEGWTDADDEGPRQKPKKSKNKKGKAKRN